jgi:hypothetical protein
MISCAAATCDNPSIIATRPANTREDLKDLDMPIFSFKVGAPTMFRVGIEKP